MGGAADSYGPQGYGELAGLFGPVGAVLVLLGATSVLVSNQLGKGSFKLDGGQEGIADNLLVPLIKQVSASHARYRSQPKIKNFFTFPSTAGGVGEPAKNGKENFWFWIRRFIPPKRICIYI